jgi:tRNA threonylcarbamoyladenosine biosynthesis protein TsaE
MRGREPLVYRSSSPERTAAFARRLAGTLPRGTVLALTGPLGSGKTAFVRGLAAGLGLRVREAVSPTYTLVLEHPGPVPLFHADLYRLERPEEVEELGLEEYAERGGILAVEWAERAGGLLPREAIAVCFEVTGARTRTITLRYPEAPTPAPPARRRVTP